MAPILPFLSETMYRNLVTSVAPDAPDSVHLTAWPSAELRPGETYGAVLEWRFATRSSSSS